MPSSELWGSDLAARYDQDVADMFAPDVLEPTVDLLARLADGGPALEFAVGTGRVALPLARRGIAVTGIEYSPAMAERLRAKPGADQISVALGDMAETRVPGRFALVYLVFNTLSNLRTQAEQVECFRNAARHLRPGGHFVLELWVPALRRLPPGQSAVPDRVDEDHLTFDTYDVVSQECASHHYVRDADGTVRASVGRFRYAWPAECDLMAALAGLVPVSRHADWRGSPFTAESAGHVSVWRKPD